MSNCQYLVTGGAGFIGSHIATALAERGASVRVLDNLSTGKRENLKHLDSRIEFVRGDLRDQSTVQAAAEGVEVIFHQGALASVPRSIADPVSTIEANVNGTLQVLLAAREAGVRRVVYASSSSVYGNLPTLPKVETMPTCPLSPYAISKLTGEQLCLEYARICGFESVALRYFNVFGPRQDPHSTYAAVIPRFLVAMLQGEMPTIYGDGEQTRDFTYIENVVAANLLAADATAANGLAINIGCGERVSLNEVLRLAGELVGRPVKAIYTDPRPGDVRDSLADISLASTALGYRPNVPFRVGMARTLDALREDMRHDMIPDMNHDIIPDRVHDVSAAAREARPPAQRGKR
jgi:UDP-glucose 4-epimerase